mgnify:CR=1 FL=1
MQYLKKEIELDYARLEINPPKDKVYLECYILDKSLDIEMNQPENKRPAILVLPGGGYHMTSKREGEPIALQFLAAGYSVFKLDYSVAPDAFFPCSLFQVYTAIKMIRDNADKWAVDCDKIAVCGFSAGGHLTASCGAFWDRDFVKDAGFSDDKHKPNALVLCYPVISGGTNRQPGSYKNLLGTENPSDSDLKYHSIELQVTESFPRSFIWHTFTDPVVPVQNSLLLASAMADKGIMFEMHIYPEGKHGLALSNQLTSGAQTQPPEKPRAWVKDCIKFLNENAYN